MAGIGFAINKVVREKRLTSKPRAFCLCLDCYCRTAFAG